MLRNKHLIPLSRQHQRALALCVRIHRAQPVPSSDLLTWRAEIEQHFEQEIKIHFEAEEKILFPAARQFPELVALVEDLLGEHKSLRQLFSRAEAQSMTSEELSDFALLLSAHIRKEERQFFEGLQQRMTSEELTDLGIKLEGALANAAQFCALTNDATKLKTGNK
jgi:hemerythrin-like domain-containing protein